MRKVLTPLISVLVGLAFLLPVAIGLMQGRVIEIELIKPRTAKEALQQAYFKHFQEKDYQGAIEKYEEVIANFPSTEEAAEAQLRIGNIYHWNLKQPEKAIQAYQKVISGYPNTPFAVEAEVRLGEVYHWVLGDYDRAIEQYREVVVKHPDSEMTPYAQLLIAEAYTGKGQYEEAAQAYRRVVDNYPKSEFAPEALARLGGIFFRKIKDLEVSKEIYERLISEYPESKWLAEAHYYLGRYYKAHSNMKRATQEFEEVIRKYPDHITVSYLALKELDALHRYIPDYLVKILKLNNIKFYRGSEEYARLRDQFMKSYPSYCNRWINKGGWRELIARWHLASFYLDQGENDKAIQEYRSIIERFPSSRYSTASLYNLAHIYYRLKRYSESIALCQEIIKRHPQGAWNDSARLLISRNYAEQGRIQEAIQILDEIIRTSNIEMNIKIARERKIEYLKSQPPK
jgi:TolA-binding protein